MVVSDRPEEGLAMQTTISKQRGQLGQPPLHDRVVELMQTPVEDNSSTILVPPDWSPSSMAGDELITIARHPRHIATHDANRIHIADHRWRRNKEMITEYNRLTSALEKRRILHILAIFKPLIIAISYRNHQFI
jgi:hypothetical protein